MFISGKNLMLISRRKFLKYAGVTAISTFSLWLACQKILKNRKYNFSGQLLGPNHQAGHILREGLRETPTEIKKVNTLIIGGGVAGLSAAWWLKRNAYNDFILLELDTETGGTSRSGENSVSQYPWGAHYVPLPAPDSKYVLALFEEMKIISGYNNDLPVYNEFYLCADPHERLYYQGRWQDGLIPQYGIAINDKKQYREFFSFIEELKSKKGCDGRPAFVIPLALSSQDPELLKLDQITMQEFMHSRGWDSAPLNWYINYCCRDDYGAPSNRVSAWAGLHYFASRSGKAANSDSQTVLTWPQGNAFLTKYLGEQVSSHILTNHIAYHVTDDTTHTVVDVCNLNENKFVRYFADKVIYCGPQFVAEKVIENYRIDDQYKTDYAPWLVANITLSEMPSSRGVDLSWDNVNYYSNSLGYIVATHQDLRQNRKELVITYYLPLDAKEPKEARKESYRKTYQDWLNIILPDLEKTHRGITKNILNLDLWVWGHGMVLPRPGYIWKQKRLKKASEFGNIYFAHSDLSGIAIFEEAQYWGVRAAQKILKQVIT